MLTALLLTLLQSEPPLDPGYAWSPPLPKPGPLVAVSRRSLGMAAGDYDVCVTLIGDNLKVTAPTGFKRVTLPAGGGLSIRYSAAVQTAAQGWMPWVRAPGGVWRVGQPPNAGPYPFVAAPITPHFGGDYQRWGFNGWVWQEAAYFSQDGPQGRYWASEPALGPPRWDGTTQRIPDPNPGFSPDVTRLSCVPNQRLLVAWCWVDQFGREGPTSDPCFFEPLPSGQASYLELTRPGPTPHGACAFRLFAGSSVEALKRVPVLDYEGAIVREDWPLHLRRVFVHSLRAAGASPCPTAARSILNPLQQDLLAGKTAINRPGEWKLYCPLVMPLAGQRRVIGSYTDDCRLVHQPVQVGVGPAILSESQHDKLLRVSVETPSAVAAWGASSWSGSNCFSLTFDECRFIATAPDAYGLLVDDHCESESHTASECEWRNCTILASRPIKFEGIQTAKMRFTGQVYLHCTGLTRYPSEVCAVGHFSSNHLVLENVAGITDLDTFRTAFACYSPAGQPKLTVGDFFVDRGCPVLVGLGPNTGGNVKLSHGKNGVYPVDRNWFRLVEAVGLRSFARVDFDRCELSNAGSSINCNLNQLAVMSSTDPGRFVTLTEAQWTGRGLLLQFGGMDWTKRQKLEWSLGAAR